MKISLLITALSTAAVSAATVSITTLADLGAASETINTTGQNRRIKIELLMELQQSIQRTLPLQPRLISTQVIVPIMVSFGSPEGPQLDQH